MMARSVLFFSLLTGIASLRAQEPWQTQKALNCTIHFTEENAAQIEAVSKTLRDFHESIIQATGADSKLFSEIGIDIYLYPAASTEVSVHNISLSGGPRKNGETLGYAGRIKMPGPTGYDGKQTSSNGHPMDRNSFDKFLVHEIAPAYLELYARSRGTRFNNQVPDWFEQGLEEYFAVFHSTPYWRTTGIKVYHKRLKNDPATIDTDFRLNVRDRYNDGFIVLNFSRDEFGEKAIIEILGASEPTFGRQLKKSLGVSFDEFLRRFDSWRTTRAGQAS
jgi:hypothetical protein